MMGNAIKNKTISKNQPTMKQKLDQELALRWFTAFSILYLKNGGQTTTLSVGLNSYIN